MGECIALRDADGRRVSDPGRIRQREYRFVAGCIGERVSKPFSKQLTLSVRESVAECFTVGFTVGFAE